LLKRSPLKKLQKRPSPKRKLLKRLLKRSSPKRQLQKRSPLKKRLPKR